MSSKVVPPALFFYQPRMGMIFVVSEFRLRGKTPGKLSFSDVHNKSPRWGMNIGRSGCQPSVSTP